MKKMFNFVLFAAGMALVMASGFGTVKAEAKEVNNLAMIVKKAVAIQNGEWDSSLGPYSVNGVTEYRYILSHDGNRNNVTLRLVRCGGLDQLAADLASVL